MKQIALSIEQMQHLQELGLDTSDASMYWYKEKKDDTPSLYLNTGNIRKADLHFKKAIYAYTLQNILDKLPSYIDNPTLNISFQLIINKGINNCYYIEYDSINTIYDKTLISFQDKDILKVAYYVLKWCIENGHIKTNKK